MYTTRHFCESISGIPPKILFTCADKISLFSRVKSSIDDEHAKNYITLRRASTTTQKKRRTNIQLEISPRQVRRSLRRSQIGTP